MERDPLQLAYLQTVFRAANEAIRRAGRDDCGRLKLICECGSEACRETLELTSDEYEEVRSDGRAFALREGHEADVELVVARFDRFTRVEKVGKAGEWAKQHDPRREP